MIHLRFAASILGILLLAGPVTAQVKNSDFQKLFDLYTMEQYDKCLWKAERAVNNSKYSRDPEPYLYMALCMYQVHIDPTAFDQEYKDPLKDALSYAYKFRKKDKGGEMYQANKPLLDKIREQALDQAKYFFNDGEYRKASSEFNRILKVMPDDVNILFMAGVSDLLARNIAVGEKNIGVALDTLNNQMARGAFEKDPVTYDVMIKAFVGYTDYLAENAKLDRAMEVITFGRKLVPDDPKLKGQYKKIYEFAPE
jgi:tetratricopeptide (TPR) repeat protein